MTGYTTPTKKQASQTVTLIGVAGGSGSGKTTFAKRLLKSLETEFGKDSCNIISQDSYYIDQSHKFDQDGGTVNFDHPDALDFRLLCSHLRSLHEGESIQIPIYDFSTHKRLPHAHVLKPTKFVIVDGTLILSQPEIVNQLDAAIFLDVPEATRFERRLRRDTQERGRTPEGVEKQFTVQVKPMHDQYVQPSYEHATWVIPHDSENNSLHSILNQVIDWSMGEILHLKDNSDQVKAPYSVIKTPPKLVIFDLDSTLILNEGIDELAKAISAETFRKVQELTSKAMQGQIDFKTAFLQRIDCLKDLKPQHIQTAQEQVQIRKGAEELVRYFHQMGSEIAIVSGGFHWFADEVAKKLNIQSAFCHHFSLPLEISEGKIIDSHKKAEWVKRKMTELNLKPSEVWVFGDGANDRHMMRLAGIRVAVQGKDKLKQEANIHLNSGDFSVLLNWLISPKTSEVHS